MECMYLMIQYGMSNVNVAGGEQVFAVDKITTELEWKIPRNITAIGLQQ